MDPDGLAGVEARYPEAIFLGGENAGYAGGANRAIEAVTAGDGAGQGGPDHVLDPVVLEEDADASGELRHDAGLPADELLDVQPLLEPALEHAHQAVRVLEEPVHEASPQVRHAVVFAGRMLGGHRLLARLAERGIDPDALLPSGLERVYMEDIRESLPGWKLLAAALLHTLLPSQLFYRLYGERVNIEQPFVILFSSGSESAPKGIVLSHFSMIASGLRYREITGAPSSRMAFTLICSCT